MLVTLLGVALLELLIFSLNIFFKNPLMTIGIQAPIGLVATIIYFINTFRLVASFKIDMTPSKIGEHWEGEFRDDKTLIVKKVEEYGSSALIGMLINIFLFLSASFWFIPYLVFALIKNKNVRKNTDL